MPSSAVAKCCSRLFFSHTKISSCSGPSRLFLQPNRRLQPTTTAHNRAQLRLEARAPPLRAEATDSAGGRRDAERAARRQGGRERPAGAGHLVQLRHHAQPRLARRRGPRRATTARRTGFGTLFPRRWQRRQPGSLQRTEDVVVVNLMSVMGQIIPPTINSSMSILLHLLQGCTEEYKTVHVEEVALAHVLVFEKPSSASGRHVCAESIHHFSDFAVKLAELYPSYKVPKLLEDSQPGLVRAEAEVASKKLFALGLQFSPLEKIVGDAVESLKSRGYIL